MVALESTLLAHGLPPDKRFQVGLELEALVRSEGAIPATIAVIDGSLCVGLDEKQLKRLCEEPVRKASVRDLSVALAVGGIWATTVASTMHIAAAAQIKVFATGGIGGVHRGAHLSFDESADLLALRQYPVAVVSAGAKAILDLRATYERLETLGVPVLGFETEYFPAFYSASRQIPLSHHFTSPSLLSQILRHRFEDLKQGGVLVVQNPPEEAAQDAGEVERLIESSLHRALKEGITGSAITPYLLSALDQASAGSVVETNIALVRNNARLAARIAVAGASSF